MLTSDNNSLTYQETFEQEKINKTEIIRMKIHRMTMQRV